MFGSLENEAVNAWFRRLDAGWKYMPAEEQARQREEVQQHLEALMAANEELGSSPEEAMELALAQFGAPRKFGRRMAQEWQRRQGWASVEGAFILYGVGAFAVSAVVIQAICWAAATLYHVLTAVDISASIPTLACELVGVPIATGLALGWKYPAYALTGSLYTTLTMPILSFFTALFAAPIQNSDGAWAGWGSVAGYAAGILAGSLLLTCGAAYLASVTKRGWYRPTRDDFKLTMPK